MRGWADEWRYSPAVGVGELVFVSACTGAQPVFGILTHLKQQLDSAFQNVSAVLAEAGASLKNIVDLTTYHVELPHHIDLFTQVKNEYLEDRRSAWTTIGLSDLVVPVAKAEIKAIAYRGSTDPVWWSC